MLKKVDQLEEEYRSVVSQPKFKHLNDLMEENSKLLYQKEQLEKALKRTEAGIATHQICISAGLIASFDEAIKAAFPDLPSVSVVITPSSNPKFGDYQCNNALSLSKELAAVGIKLAPRDVSAKIIEHLVIKPIMEKVEIAGPGFVNIFISKDFIEQEITKLVRLGFSLEPPKRKLKVIVDMSSPNIAKEMHVGHLRSTIIGESCSRILAFMGHDVLKLNHMGDWGTQFGMLIAHLKDTFKDLGDKPLPISDLQSFYKESKKRFDDDAEFKKRAYAAVVKLQSYDPQHIRDWEKICDASKKEFNEIYRRMDIENLVPRGESFYQIRMGDLVRELEENGRLENDEGRKILWTSGSNIPLTVVKSDGGYTYDTSDLTAIRQRIYEEGAERIIYVVDSGQGVHFQTIFSAAEKVGFVVPGKHRVEHVGFGVVLGEDKKKFKTRSGDTVKLIDLLDEGVERAKAKLVERGRDKELTPEEQHEAAEAVAYGCIKYADLTHNRINDYVFSFDRMLDDRGNTAAYLLYAYTRIRSIVRKTGWSDAKVTEVKRGVQRVHLDHPTEVKLGKCLCRLPEVMIRLEEELLFHKLCDYLYEVSCTFTEFYDACYCIEQDKGEIIKIDESRILLCEATASVMKCCFDILGIRTVQKM